MAQMEIRLPKMGESVTEATITNWLKNIGDSVAMDEALVEVATDKVDNELPSEAEGILVKIFFEKDQVAQVGDVIAIISTDGALVSETKTASVDEIIQEIAPTVNHTAPTIIQAVSDGNGNKFYSPLVRSIAEKEGISNNELDTIPGTGQEGRVTKKDILDFVANRGNQTQTSVSSIPASPVTPTVPAVQVPAQAPATAIKEVVAIPSGNDEIIEMDRMRKLIADHMVMSKHTSPHVTSFVEADVTNIIHALNSFN